MDNIKNISRFVGELQTDKKCYMSDNKEDYYITHLFSYGASIPVAMSEHFFNMYKGKRVSILAFPRISRKRVDGERKIFSYLSCILVEETTDPVDLRYVEIEGKVVSTAGLRLSRNNLSQSDFELECCVKFDKAVRFQVPCRAFEAVARELLTIQKGDILHVTGYVAGYNETLRVIVKKCRKEEA